jgi:hypothetical protein
VEETMRKLMLVSLLVAVVIVPLVYVTPAAAQATRTWVSGVGDDANPCSRTAPCKTFAGAISKTATGGEINVLDPGGFGGVTITKSISIIADYVEAGVLVSGTNAIIVNAPAGSKVLLQGLDIEGLGTGLTGVSFLGGSQLYIIRCSIRNFTQNGINVASTTAGGGHAFIHDSYIINNGVLNSNPLTGGVNAAASNIASLTNTNVLSNANFAVQANGAGAIVGLQTSVLNNSPAGISTANGGAATCIGPSNLVVGTGTCGTTLFK